MDALNVSKKIIKSHLISGKMVAGFEIALKIDQTLTQDATGTLVMLELEAMGIVQSKTELSVQYVDHNLLEVDSKNAEDHLFLLSASEKYGIWYSPAGNGISHPLHIHHFGVPGKTLIGSDSHTASAGALGMLAIGTGGLDVALAIAGEPYPVKMPKIFGVELTGKLPSWVSAKDIILEMLRRIGVRNGKGWIFEYYGDGLKHLSIMDRLVIANMGTEMGATSSVFPSDEETLRFLKSQNRGDCWKELKADKGAEFDKEISIVLPNLEPLIACPQSPGNIVKVREVSGKAVHQVVIGSSANPGMRDYAIVSAIVKGRKVPAGLSFDINPSTRQVIETLSDSGLLTDILKAGARFHQVGCLGCIGMGQAPASGKISLRTMPRNFPGRSGTLDDQVYLCSPETAAASALTGKITDPRDLEKLHGLKYPEYKHPAKEIIHASALVAPQKQNANKILEKGSNIKPLPEFDPLKENFKAPVTMKFGNDISTDEILSGGANVLPLRSNIPEISKWTYYQIDKTFYKRALEAREQYGGHFIVAGSNYAQGSSREHAALAPKFLGQIAVFAVSYARIGWQNLVNYGILPFEFTEENDYEQIEKNDILRLDFINENSLKENKIIVHNVTQKKDFQVTHNLSARQIQIILKGGMINFFRAMRSMKTTKTKVNSHEYH